MLPVRYVSEARQDEVEIIRRVLRKWGPAAAIKLDKQLGAAIEQIARQPMLFQVVEDRPKLRCCVVTPQTSIFFEASPNEIVIKWVFENRMAPNRVSERD